MDRYLNRINISSGSVSVDLKTLRRLQRQHLLNVPFENLDIHWKKRIVVDTKAFYDKIAVRGRGGFCYELNGLFNELLQRTGFVSRLVSARVFRDDGSVGPEFDHAAIIVNINGQEYLVDVGFGDFAVEPLRLASGDLQQVNGQTFIVESADDSVFKVSRIEEDDWKGQYIFGETARHLDEFQVMCDFQQESPESHFTQRKICSILTETGRKTLTDDKFIVTTNGHRTEMPIRSEDEFYKLLESEFQIVKPAELL